MRSIAVDLRRVPLLFYIASILICLVFILLSTAYFADDPADNKSMLVYMLGGERSLSALDMWHNALSSSDMNSWLLILTPLICCIGYVYAFCIEISTKSYIFSLHRQGLRRFVLSRFLGCGLYSAAIMLSALMMSFITCVLYSGRLGSYPYAPIFELLFHCQSSFAAAVEVCLTYAVYAFFVGIVCITLAAVVSNSFTSCSTLVLVLFLCGDIQSSYAGRFTHKMVVGEVQMSDYNHLTDFLFVGNLAHGMPQFQKDLHVSYIVYILALFVFLLILYLIFRFVMKKKVLL
jgi:hypothetical protein